MLAAQYRMTRSAEFADTVKRGVRAAEPDLVVHLWQDRSDPSGPRIGLIVGKSVGNAVHRHQVSRRLRHTAKNFLGDLAAEERVVIRALPGSRVAASDSLERQLGRGLRRSHQTMRTRS